MVYLAVIDAKLISTFISLWYGKLLMVTTGFMVILAWWVVPIVIEFVIDQYSVIDDLSTDVNHSWTAFISMIDDSYPLSGG